MRTTPQLMNVFARAVEANSFIGASRSLLVDPTAVSRAIKALEAELGVPLFLRSTRTLKLTAEGATFYRDCVKILESIEQATRKFRGDARVPRGRLTIGMAPALAQRMLLRVIPSFRIKYPEVDIVLLNISDLAQIGDTGIDVILRGRANEARRNAATRATRSCRAQARTIAIYCMCIT
jgi:LysR family transcriptional regulator for bpeEF and oprC